MVEPYPPIPGAAIAGLIISILICVGLPVGGYIWCRKKYGCITKVFFIGVAAFTVSQMLIRIPIVTLVLPQFSWYQTLPYVNLPLYAILLAFTAGLFEETARFICVRFFLKERRSYGNSIAFGFGHGGIEAVLITLPTLMTYLVYCAAINNGTYSAMVSAVPQVQAQVLTETLYALTFTGALVGGMERIIAVALHIGLSVVVFHGFRVGKPWLYLLLAIVIHTAFDYPAVIFPAMGVGTWLTELLFAAMTMILWAVILITKRRTERRE